MNRPWPHRSILRIDKEIKSIIVECEKRGKKIGIDQRNAESKEIHVDESQLDSLRLLLRKRAEETRAVYIKKS